MTRESEWTRDLLEAQCALTGAMRELTLSSREYDASLTLVLSKLGTVVGMTELVSDAITKHKRIKRLAEEGTEITKQKSARARNAAAK